MEIYNISSDYVMARPVRTDAQARHCLLSVDYLPLWGPRGITSLSLMASGGANLGEGCRDFVRRKNRGIRKICGGRRLKSQDRYLFNRAKRVLTVKRIGVLEECSEAKRSQNDNLLIPLCP